MPQNEQTATLHRLSNTELTVSDPAEDIRGRKVMDKNGEEVGEVDDLLIDDREKKVRFLLVASGGFLGIGETKFLIPVDVITRIRDKTVHVDQTRQYIAGAPLYDPDVVHQDVVDRRYYDDVYSYYGYKPYWGPGYAYPRYPFYPDPSV